MEEKKTRKRGSNITLLSQDPTDGAFTTLVDEDAGLRTVNDVKKYMVKHNITGTVFMARIMPEPITREVVSKTVFK